MSKSISYDVDIATEHGIAVAILYNNIKVFVDYHADKAEGDYWHSMKDIAKGTGLSEYQVREAAKKAKEVGLIDYKSGYKPNSTIKTTYWYLSNSSTSETIETATSVDTETATSLYKSKRIKSKRITIEINKDLEPILEEYKRHRRLIKVPLTEHGLRLVVKKLKKLSPDIQTQKAILEQSIENGWRGIFPLNSQGDKSQWF